MIMTDRDTIRPQDLPEPLREKTEAVLPEASGIKTLREFRDLAERDFLLAKLEANGWNISQTAREIDTPRSNLYKKLEQYGIKITAGAGETVASPSREGGEEESPDSEGRMVANRDSGRPGESATENTPPSGGSGSPGSKGEMAR